MNKTILYYSHNIGNSRLLRYCAETLRESAGSIPIISVTHKPTDLGRNIVIRSQKPSILCMYQQLLIGAQEASPGLIFLAEHDVLYPQKYFDVTPPQTLYMSQNMYYLTSSGFFDSPKNRSPLSTLVMDRELLIRACSERVAFLLREGTHLTWSEIGKSDPYSHFFWLTQGSTYPVVDVRHKKNYTGTRAFAIADLSDEIPFWGSLSELRLILEEETYATV